MNCFGDSAAQAAQPLGDAMAGDGKGNTLRRHIVLFAAVLAVRFGAAGAARYFNPAGQALVLVSDNRALAQVRLLNTTTTGSARINLLCFAAALPLSKAARPMLFSS